ncbi:MAG: hypothetical protein OFPII_08500 [Osedax symbiont Rs1]|nr:MAG: hypothetical protein OFPII_08500 [Osedax symbiont Rs1]
MLIYTSNTHREGHTNSAISPFLPCITFTSNVMQRSQSADSL